MRYPPQFLDELRARLPVSEVVGRRVALKKAGREFKGLSPFNKEKTASFTVNDQKGFFHDFSSGKSGDIFNFVMETEGVTFPEAVERLAGMAGVPMPTFSKDEEEREEKRKTLHEVMELAAKYFEATLNARPGAKARGYLADRGLEPATQIKFRLGYAPAERFGLKEHLGKQGVTVPDMIETGLLIAGDDIPVPYDRFRDRVMFPITDLRGRIIAFGGRALDKDAPAKYLNSPETPLFHKGSNLYNGAPARQAAHDGAPVIAVEGYVDVIAMVTAGFPATVAPLGTALTEDQLTLLWKMADEPILCFDGDKAGRKAAYRAVDLAMPRLKPGKSLRFALLPEGQDPDDLARSGGRAAIAEVLQGAQPLAEMLWTRETESAAFDTPERRAALEARVNEIVRGIGDETVRRYYSQDFTARLRDQLMPKRDSERFERPRWQDGNGRSGNWSGGSQGGRRFSKGGNAREPLPVPSPRLSSSTIVRGFRSAMPAREALILLAVINHPWLLETRDEEFAELEFRHSDADLLRRAILDAMAKHETPDSAPDTASLRAAIAASGLNSLLSRLDVAMTHGADWAAREGAAIDDVELFWKQVVALHHKVRTLNRDLKEAECAFSEDPNEGNWARFRDVQASLSALDGMEAQIEGFGASSGRLVRGG